MLCEEHTAALAGANVEGICSSHMYFKVSKFACSIADQPAVQNWATAVQLATKSIIGNCHNNSFVCDAFAMLTSMSSARSVDSSPV